MYDIRNLLLILSMLFATLAPAAVNTPAWDATPEQASAGLCTIFPKWPRCR